MLRGILEFPHYLIRKIKSEQFPNSVVQSYLSMVTLPPLISSPESPEPHFWQDVNGAKMPRCMQILITLCSRKNE